MLLSTDVLLINTLRRYERNGITQLCGKYITQPCQILRCKVPKKCFFCFLHPLGGMVPGFVCVFFLQFDQSMDLDKSSIKP